MTDNNDARIAAIREKAEGFGLTIMEVEQKATQQIAIRLMKHHGIEAQEIAEVYDLATAESLLAALAPGPVDKGDYEAGVLHGDARTRGIYRLLVRQCIEDFEERVAFVEKSLKHPAEHSAERDAFEYCADALREKFSMILGDDDE